MKTKKFWIKKGRCRDFKRARYNRQRRQPGGYYVAFPGEDDPWHGQTVRILPFTRPFRMADALYFDCCIPKHRQIAVAEGDKTRPIRVIDLW